MFWLFIRLQERNVCGKNPTETVSQQDDIQIISLMGRQPTGIYVSLNGTGIPWPTYQALNWSTAVWIPDSP